MSDNKILQKISYINPQTGYGVEFVKWKEKKYHNGMFAWRTNKLNYIKMFKDGVISSDLSDNTIGKFYKLLHMCGTNNIVRGEFGNPLWASDIANLFNISSSAAYKLLADLAKSNMVRGIEINGQKLLMVNPLYGLFGKKVTDLTIYVFQDFIFDTISSNEIKRDIINNCIYKWAYDKNVKFILPERVLDGQIRIARANFESKENEPDRLGEHAEGA